MEALGSPVPSEPLPGVLVAASATPRDFVLTATDRQPLAARLWATPIAPVTTAVINAGAGIDMPYYDRFAQFLATHRIPTLVYDYRGIGRSRPKKLRGFIASVEDWGSKDCAAALEWMSAKFPEARRVVIGHSIGSFVTGFAANGCKIDRMLLVGAHTGYWRDYAPRQRLAMYLLWHALMPAVTRVVGYFPGRRLHLLDDLPAGVALEWANRRQAEFWWNRVTADGTPDTQWRDKIIGRFLAIRASTLALRFTDDAFATEAATTRILGLYQNCRATSTLLGPDDVGGQKIGHFGFFRARFRDTLWARALAWLSKDE
jgi:predicted alpha/beta hydrolase